MAQHDLLTQLTQHFCCLPGVGTKTAQRMVFHVLQRDPQGARKLAEILLQALNTLQHCSRCRAFSESTLCLRCVDVQRDHSLVCIVEQAFDMDLIEQTGVFQGGYFVLHGQLSPLDGIGPEALGIPVLQQRMATGTIKELILATNSTVESLATADFISQLAQPYAIKVSRMAQGIPMGGELAFIDRTTLAHALQHRQVF